MVSTFFHYPGVPGREQNFDEKARNFLTQSTKLADTANMVATAGGCRNKKTVEAIFATSAQVNYLLFFSFFV